MTLRTTATLALGMALCIGGLASADEKKATKTETKTEMKTEKKEMAGHDHGSMANDPMMQAWMKAATPGEPHKMLMNRGGKWKIAVTSWMQPGAEPMKSDGACNGKPILGGRFLYEECTGSMMGQPFEGIGISGYDNTMQKHVSTWMDNMGTMQMNSAGDYDAASKTLRMTATYMDPMSGKSKTTKMMTKLESDNRQVFEMWDTAPDGKDFKAMEIVYTRM